MDNERFVLSAHGSAGKRENFVFTIPRNIILCTYSGLNVCGYYENWSPTAVCIGTYLSRPVIGRFTGGQTFPNFYLWADGDIESNRSRDGTKTFHSGVKRCSDGRIVINIDDMPCIANLTEKCRYRTTLDEIVNRISLIQFQEATLRGGAAIAEIHLLICLGDVHPGVMAIMAAQSSGRHCSGSGPGCARMGGGRHRKSRKKQQRKKNRSRSKKPHK